MNSFVSNRLSEITKEREAAEREREREREADERGKERSHELEMERRAIDRELRLAEVNARTSANNDSSSLKLGVKFDLGKFDDSKDLEMVVYLIKNVYFQEESKGKSIFYYQDSKGFFWLNFDYNDSYPGGKYMSDVRESEILI